MGQLNPKLNIHPDSDPFQIQEDNKINIIYNTEAILVTFDKRDMKSGFIRAFCLL